MYTCLLSCDRDVRGSCRDKKVDIREDKKEVRSNNGPGLKKKQKTTKQKTNLDSFVAVFRGEDQTRQVRGQVQAPEVPHQVPKDDGVLTEKLVGVDHLDGKNKKVSLLKELEL